MYLLKAMTHPNGAQTTVHRIGRVELVAAGALMPLVVNAVQVHISHYTAPDATTLAYQTTFSMDLADFEATPYPQNVIDFLSKPGGPLEGAQLAQDQDTDLSRAQKLATTRVDKIREERIAGGFTVEDIGTFDSDPLSMRNLTGKAQRAAIAIQREEADWETPWKLKDNSMTLLTAEKMIEVGEAVDAHITGCYARSWELKALIAEAETAAAVEAINLTTDWP